MLQDGERPEALTPRAVLPFLAVSSSGAGRRVLYTTARWFLSTTHPQPEAVETVTRGQPVEPVTSWRIPGGVTTPGRGPGQFRPNKMRRLRVITRPTDRPTVYGRAEAFLLRPVMYTGDGMNTSQTPAGTRGRERREWGLWGRSVSDVL